MFCNNVIEMYYLGLSHVAIYSRKVAIGRLEFKVKITKHDKKKNDKDVIGNILLKHVFTNL
jgi:hypothetical protein